MKPMKTITELSSLTNRVALITGGGGHIAFAMSEALLENGCNVILADMNKDRLETSKAKLEEKFKTKVLVYELDLEVQSQVEALSAFVKEKYGRLDILINNAGFVGDAKLEGWCVPFEDQKIETWRRALEVNLNAAFHLTQLVTPLLKASGKGSVINIGSIYGVVAPDMKIYDGTAMGNPAAYATSKAGLIHLTKWMSTVLAPNIRVNAMTPGGVFRDHKDPFLKAYVDKTPLGRMGTEEDFKGVILFLASDLSNYVTGQNIIVDGGWTTWQEFMSKVIIIAEAGVNHNGSMELAKKLIDVAAEAKADYVKFQTWITDNVMEVGAPKAEYQKVNDASDDQYSMVKKLEFSFPQFKELFDYCAKKGVGFLSTPEETLGLNFLADDLNLPILKVGSGELDNLIFLKDLGAKKKKVILSTGMGTLEETKRAYELLLASGAAEVTILHCTSNYPALPENLNLKAITTLRETFKTPIGYSDHSIGTEVSIAAVALGATVIEKHFTLDKTMPGPDHAASLDPQELKMMVDQIRNIEKAMSGNGKKEPQESEIEVKKVVRKGPYLARAMKAGEALTPSDLHFKRPVRTISADKTVELIGKKLGKDLPKGHCLELSDF